MDSDIDVSAADLARHLPATTYGADETQRVGRELAGVLKPGSVVALYGNLGAGKTVFVRGICEGAGMPPDIVTSPTFTIIHEYREARPPVFHFDAYRIKRVEELYAVLWEDYFFGDGISIVEWADRIEPLLPEGTLRIRIEHGGGDVRRIVPVATDAELHERPRHESA